MSDADPIAEFKQAFEEYRRCQVRFVECGKNSATPYKSDTWERRDLERKVASEGLWVSGMASLFDLVTKNYQAQERLLENQLELAKRNSKAADKVAWWTMALVIVTGVLILATVFTGLLGLFTRC